MRVIPCLAQPLLLDIQLLECEAKAGSCRTTCSLDCLKVNVCANKINWFDELLQFMGSLMPWTASRVLILLFFNCVHFWSSSPASCLLSTMNGVFPSTAAHMEKPKETCVAACLLSASTTRLINISWGNFWLLLSVAQHTFSAAAEGVWREHKGLICSFCFSSSWIPMQAIYNKACKIRFDWLLIKKNDGWDHATKQSQRQTQSALLFKSWEKNKITSFWTHHITVKKLK